MTAALTLQELLIWNQEASDFWKAHLDAHLDLLQLPCGIGGNVDVQSFVRHIWGAELVWSQIFVHAPITDYDVWPTGPLESLYRLHLAAVANFRALLDDPLVLWNEPFVRYPWRRPEQPKPSPRKALAHILLHSQRHWAQLATLVRSKGFPSGYLGDFLLSSALS